MSINFDPRSDASDALSEYMKQKEYVHEFLSFYCTRAEAVDTEQVCPSRFISFRSSILFVPWIIDSCLPFLISFLQCLEEVRRQEVGFATESLRQLREKRHFSEYQPFMAELRRFLEHQPFQTFNNWFDHSLEIMVHSSLFI